MQGYILCGAHGEEGGEKNKNTRTVNITFLIFTKQKCCAIMLYICWSGLFSMIKNLQDPEERRILRAPARKKKGFVRSIAAGKARQCYGIGVP